MSDTIKETTVEEMPLDLQKMEEELRLPIPYDFVPIDVLKILATPVSFVTGNNNVSKRLKIGRPDNVWNFKEQRLKFQHLLNDTICTCGAGESVTFLCSHERPTLPITSKPSILREDNSLDLSRTIVPEEYHLKKARRVLGIDIPRDRLESLPSQHESHITIFPSLRPSSRHEIRSLLQVMDVMLEKAGVTEEQIDQYSMANTSQIEQMVHLVKKEQDMYNVIFHELIRQVSVGCVDRGKALSEIRRKYWSLLNRIPRQMMNLHEELLAQRALDRQLTSHFSSFRATMSELTLELGKIQSHAHLAKRATGTLKAELRRSMWDAKQATNILDTYRKMETLQRQRLEGQVDLLRAECTAWRELTQLVAQKAIEEHNLAGGQRMMARADEWSTKATFITETLKRSIADDVTKALRMLVKVNDLMSEAWTKLVTLEEHSSNRLSDIAVEIEALKITFQKYVLVSRDEGFVKMGCDLDLLDRIHREIHGWISTLFAVAFRHDIENVKGHIQLIKEAAKEGAVFIKLAGDVMQRQQYLNEANDQFEDLRDQFIRLLATLSENYEFRATGTNGLVTGIHSLSNHMEIWHLKVVGAYRGKGILPGSEWSRLNIYLGEWLSRIEDLRDIVGVAKPSQLDTPSSHPRKESTYSTTSDQMSLLSIPVVPPIRQLTPDDIKLSGQQITEVLIRESENAAQELAIRIASTHQALTRCLVGMLVIILPNHETSVSERHSEGSKKMTIIRSEMDQLLEKAGTMLDTSTKALSATSEKMLNSLGADAIKNISLETIDTWKNTLKQLEVSQADWLNTARCLREKALERHPILSWSQSSTEEMQVQSLLVDGNTASFVMRKYSSESTDGDTEQIKMLQTSLDNLYNTEIQLQESQVKVLELQHKLAKANATITKLQKG